MTAVGIQSLKTIQKGISNSVRVLESEIVSSPLSGLQVKEAAAEMIPPATLFHPEIVTLPSFYRELRRSLDHYGASLQQHSSRRAIMTLATELYTQPEDTNAAIEMAKAIVAAGRRATPLTRQAANIAAVESSDTRSQATANYQVTAIDRVVQNVAMRLKDREKKFVNDLGESWMEYVSEYQQISRDYNLNAAQKLQYLHNILRDDAKRFYLNHV